MGRKNYDKMYNSEGAKSIQEKLDELKEEASEEIKEEPKKEVKKTPSTGKVISGSLNVRKAPGGQVIKVLNDGQKVQIAEEDGDWYKISGPFEGYVMKKFIEV